MEYSQILADHGFMPELAGGIQIDINAVKHGDTESSICNHNCTTIAGGYNCPAAFTLNKGVKPVYAQSSTIIAWILNSCRAIRSHRDKFLKDGLAEFAYKHKIPVPILSAIERNIKSQMVEINLFGGNPEMHPEIIRIIHGIKSLDAMTRVNITTTGRRFLMDSSFAEKLFEAGLDSAALSIDDITPSELTAITAMDDDTLKQAWKGINPLHGQRQKAYEAVYAARQLSTYKIPVLANMVIHPGNYKFIEKSIEIVNEIGITANPYPFQTWFDNEPSDAPVKFVLWFEKFIDKMIESNNHQMIKRTHYWLMLKSVYLAFHDCGVRAQYLAGKAWKCYQNPIMPYLQIGRGVSSSDEPGGHPGCFWNPDTVTTKNQAESVASVSSYLESHMRLAPKLAESPCNGCAMPRLAFGLITLESGLHQKLWSPYLTLRRIYLGF